MVLHHEVDGAVGLEAQDVAQIVVFTVPDQQPLTGGVLPPEGVLVLVEGVHAVMAVDVHEEELHSLGQHGVAAAHGDAVDVGAHGGFGLEAPGPQQAAGLPQAAVEHLAVH